MWLDESGGCGTVCAEMWWAGKREGTADKKMAEMTLGLRSKVMQVVET